MLVEATRDTSFAVGYGVEVQADAFCELHGTLDALVYQRKEESALDN